MKTISMCRICRSSRVGLWLDLGETPLANAFLAKEDLDKPEARFPLRVMFCEACGLSQLGDVVEPETLFRDYVYFTSAIPRVPEHFRNYANEAVDRFAGANGFVVEIGSNDGILLRAAKERGARVLGVDPAKNIARVANERGIPTIAEFFSEALAAKIASEYGRADIIIGNNVVAHIDDHHDLMRGVTSLLSDGGAFIFEAPYLVDMFERLAFDSVYHEHLSYLSLRPLARLMAEHGMEIFDVKTFPVQGKSLRAWAGRIGRHPIMPAVSEFLAHEHSFGLDAIASYHELAKKIATLKRDVVATLADLKTRGARIAAYGAPARGNTILNYYGIGRELLDHATEELPTKIGRYTPGSHLPIIHIDESRKNPPDYYFLLAWNYRDAVWEKEGAFRERGGKFIFPIGEERII